MSQPFSKVLDSVSSYEKIATWLMDLKGTKMAAKIVKSKLTTMNQKNIITILNSNILYTTPDFYPFINIYKNSTYAQADATFANEIMKCL